METLAQAGDAAADEAGGHTGLRNRIGRTWQGIAGGTPDSLFWMMEEIWKFQDARK